ncbi:MAG: ECF transporter S component, partial [Oscillospiraceae bacterium]|nr:ECF transporter S component [Oscillospiraceae bacterium]
SAFLEMVTISSTGVYGFLMNAIATCAFTVPAAWVYAKMRSQKGAVIGLLSGVLTMAVCMVAWNYIITPYYMSNDQVSVAQMRRTVAGMLLPVFLPFNLVKGGLNAALAMLLYKPVVGALRRVGLVAQSSSGKKGRFSLGSTLAAAAVLATFVLLFLILIKVI